MTHNNNSRHINLYHICTWQPASRCGNCELAGKLKCRLSLAAQIRFIGLFLIPAAPAIAGVILGGYGWYLFGWLGFALLNFTFWEARVLCSHCPFWAEERTVLRCLANSGVPKFYRFHPEPLNRLEKAQVILIFLILVGYPFPFLILGGQWELLAVTVVGVALFAWMISTHVCSQCVNFSCPVNRVPRKVRDGYLHRNPVIREAWEQTGYLLDERA